MHLVLNHPVPNLRYDELIWIMYHTFVAQGDTLAHGFMLGSIRLMGPWRYSLSLHHRSQTGMRSSAAYHTDSGMQADHHCS